jgi:type I restriction enzyme, S subunit
VKAGWQRKQLGELAELRGRIGWRGLTAKEYTTRGPLFLSVHSLNYGDFVDFRDAFHISEERYVESPEIMLEEGDVLICKDGAGIGKLGIVGALPDRTTINSSLLMIRSGKLILPKFLYHCLCSPYFQEIVLSRLNGATTPHLYQRDITEFPVVLPPLAEQQRIVGILDEAFDGIATAKANAEKNLQNARALFESHLQAVFTTVGDGYASKTIAEICTLRSGTTVSSALEKPMGDLPYLKVADMAHEGNETEIFSSSRFLNKSDIGKKSVLPAGTTIFPKRGGSILTNKKRLTAVAICADLNIMGVIPSESILPKYLFFYFVNVDMRQIGSGSSIPQINNYDIEPMRISFPMQLAEQEKLVKKMDALSVETQRLESLYQRKLAALDELKKSLLHQAFSGAL